MQARFLLGPVGSGKTWRCLAEISDFLQKSPEGSPVLLIAPKQATFQLERQLLLDHGCTGFSRLFIVSFERLAQFLFEQMHFPMPRMLDEEGRLMVLRALLSKRREQLKLFRASARLNGFARQLSEALHELERQEQTPESIRRLAEGVLDAPGLNFKLHDLAVILEDYRNWLGQHDLIDSDHLLVSAVKLVSSGTLPFRFEQIWVDGFAEFSGQEMSLLSSVAMQSTRTTIALCLKKEPALHYSRTSHWSLLERSFLRIKKRFAELPGCKIQVELLRGEHSGNRYAANPVLSHIARYWDSPVGLPAALDHELMQTVRLVECSHPETEAVSAAKEVLHFVRNGGRYRDVAVLVRQLKPYHEILQRVFKRYDIPVFLDQRENVSHHPLAELTRNALRTIDRNWEHADWFGALKTGLVPVEETDIDRLENEALARGWKGELWHHPLVGIENKSLALDLERIRQTLMQPFVALMTGLGKRPNGIEMAAALRKFWSDLKVSESLDKWSQDEKSGLNPMHLTVWKQMGEWLENIERAFPDHSYGLREWLPILDSGLSGLSVGVIPPMLDQVMIGAVDRSRNPELRLAILMGMNEGVFPAAPMGSVLLSDTDRVELEKNGIAVPTLRQWTSREQFLAYVLFTRSRERMVVSYSAADADGKASNPSPFIGQLRRLIPGLKVELSKGSQSWIDSDHLCDLTPYLLRTLAETKERQDPDLQTFLNLPKVCELRESLNQFEKVERLDKLSPALAELIYGRDLRTSVSRMEQFAACPFKFFVHSGLGAKERVKYEMDVRERGNFQHEVLEAFHHHLRSQGLRWRDIEPTAARELIKTLAAARCLVFKNGLLQSTEEGRFAVRMMTESLQDFVEILVHWMRVQYEFNPVAVELAFDDKQRGLPSWRLDLGEGHQLILNGRMDRVDVCSDPDAPGEVWCVVMDYKSGDKKLDDILMRNGLQLQLPAYLKVLIQSPEAARQLGVSELKPAGAFYVRLSGQYERGQNRDEVHDDIPGDKRNAYAHKGRFDKELIPFLDHRAQAANGNPLKGDQFNFKLTKDGKTDKRQKDPMESKDFSSLLDQVETSLKQMGSRIFNGEAAVDPYRHRKQVPCQYCDYQSICRIDPWTHFYRALDQAKDGGASK